MGNESGLNLQNLLVTQILAQDSCHTIVRKVLAHSSGQHLHQSYYQTMKWVWAIEPASQLVSRYILSPGLNGQSQK